MILLTRRAYIPILSLVVAYYAWLSRRLVCVGVADLEVATKPPSLDIVFLFLDLNGQSSGYGLRVDCRRQVVHALSA